MKKNITVPGFMTLITVFLIVSLVSLGGLACAAAAGGSALADRSAEYLTRYRSAYNLSESGWQRLTAALLRRRKADFLI